MELWSSLLLLTLYVVSTLGFSRDDEGEYKIPAIPSNSRTQFYVLHDDGTYKYGYDTGTGVYEMSKKLADHNVMGFYGFRTPEGNNLKLQYTAGGEKGFVPILVEEKPSKDISLRYLQPQENYKLIPDFSHSLLFEDDKRSLTSDLKIGSETADIGKKDSSTGYVDDVQSAPKTQETPVTPAETNVREPALTDHDPLQTSARKDASYSFAYQTSDSDRKEEADSNLNVRGKYSYVADDGVRRTVSYKAGSDTGFVVDPEISPVVVAESPILVKEEVPNPKPALRTSLEGEGVLFSNIQPAEVGQPRKDASYSFGYRNYDSERKETSDSDLNVIGEYSYISDDGIRRRVNYRAGSGTGFVADVEQVPDRDDVRVLPSAGPLTRSDFRASLIPEDPLAASKRNDASYSFSYQTPDSYRKEEADADLNVRGEYGYVANDGIRRTVSYKAGSDSGFVVEPELSSVVAETAPITVKEAVPDPKPALRTSLEGEGVLFSNVQPIDVGHPRKDSSYSFGYRNYDSERKETSDSDLNVRGEYSYISDDGIRRKVNYRAGSGTGFVADVEQVPDGDDVRVLPSAVPVPRSDSRSSLTSGDPLVASKRNDASYSFSYQTPDSYRKEEADADLNVRGEYGYEANDGIRRTVSYKAGSDTGFVVDPTISPVVVAESPILVKEEVPDPKPALRTSLEGEGVLFSNIQPAEVGQPRKDASYSFGYRNYDSERKETSDSDLNVIGEYSYISDDGIRRRVNYRAGSGTGFLADVEQVPDRDDVRVLPSAGPLTRSDFRASLIPEDPLAASKRNDASYSFSYQAPDSYRKEEADADLNVRGEYGYVANDGIRRTVSYKAGSDSGFVVEPELSSVVAETAPITVKEAVPDPKPALRTSLEGEGVLFSNVQPIDVGHPRRDSSYSFGYRNYDSERKETSDSDLNVRGEYSYISDDGIRRKVNYRAGSGTGFVADVEQVPDRHDVRVLPSAVPVPRSDFKSSLTSGDPLAASKRNDASYSFLYQTPDSYRKEEADSDLNVRGEYGYVADDGIRRTVSYKAGSDTGFVVDPAISPIVVAKSPILVEEEVPDSKPALRPSLEGAGVLLSNVQPFNLGQLQKDVGYSFKYKDGDSNSKLTADPNLNVRGEYHYISDNGLRRKVNYRTESGTGFVADTDSGHESQETTLSYPEDLSVLHKDEKETSLKETTGDGDGSQVLKTEDADGVPDFKSETLSKGREEVIGDIVLNQYPATGGSKYGYVFKQI